MARTAAPNTDGSQFFIVLDDDDQRPRERQHLPDHRLGDAGMEVVDAIAAMPTAGDPTNAGT